MRRCKALQLYASRPPCSRRAGRRRAGLSSRARGAELCPAGPGWVGPGRATDGAGRWSLIGRLSVIMSCRMTHGEIDFLSTPTAALSIGVTARSATLVLGLSDWWCRFALRAHNKQCATQVCGFSVPPTVSGSTPTGGSGPAVRGCRPRGGLPRTAAPAANAPRDANNVVRIHSLCIEGFPI